MTALTSRGRDRRHLAPGRASRLMLRYDEGEYAAVSTAARRVGLTPTGYAAMAALAAATGRPAPAPDPLRDALTELMVARTQVRRFGGNVNQGVRALNATGAAPAWLERAVAVTGRAVVRLDEAAAVIVRSLS